MAIESKRGNAGVDLSNLNFGANQKSSKINQKLSIQPKELENVNAELEKAHEQGKTQITLLIQDTEVDFNYTEIKPEDIESQTFVSEANIREQEFVNPLSVRPFAEKLKKEKQRLPVLAELIESGNTKKYEVFDGSQRRLSAMINVEPLKVWFTTTKLSKDQKKNSSEQGNVFVKESIFSLYKKVSELEKRSITIEAIASKLNVGKATVYAAKKVHALAPILLAQIPSVHDLSRAQIDTLDSLSNLLNSNEDFAYFAKESWTEHCELINDMKNGKTQHNGRQANAEVIDLLLVAVDAYKKHSATSDGDVQPDQDNNLRGISKKQFVLGDTGAKAEIKYNPKNKNVSFSIHKITEDQLAEMAKLFSKLGIDYEF